jgi:hypothetical protein
MRKQNVSLRNQDGSHCRWLSHEEASRLEREGRAFRTSRPRDQKVVYRLRSAPEPSGSAPSAAALTVSDMEAVAKVRRVSERQRERLEGHLSAPRLVVEISTRVGAL